MKTIKCPKCNSENIYIQESFDDKVEVFCTNCNTLIGCISKTDELYKEVSMHEIS